MEASLLSTTHPPPCSCPHLSPYRQAVTFLSYALGAAAVLHVLTFLFTHWNTSVQAAVTCKRAYSLAAATQVQVIPDKFHGASEIVPIYKKLLVRDGTTLY